MSTLKFISKDFHQMNAASVYWFEMSINNEMSPVEHQIKALNHEFSSIGEKIPQYEEAIKEAKSNLELQQSIFNELANKYRLALAELKKCKEPELDCDDYHAEMFLEELDNQLGGQRNELDAAQDEIENATRAFFNAHERMRRIEHQSADIVRADRERKIKTN